VQRTVHILFKSIEGITGEDVSSLIKESIKENKKRIERSLSFIDNAVRITCAKKVNNGWIVKGASNQEYLVEPDLKVWTWKNNEKDKYICIVDINSDTSDEATKNDCIAKRILALHKDKFLIDEIYTLKEAM
jgi:hypothetical protein